MEISWWRFPEGNPGRWQRHYGSGGRSESAL